MLDSHSQSLEVSSCWVGWCWLMGTLRGAPHVGPPELNRSSTDFAQEVYERVGCASQDMCKLSAREAGSQGFHVGVRLMVQTTPSTTPWGVHASVKRPTFFANTKSSPTYVLTCLPSFTSFSDA